MVSQISFWSIFAFPPDASTCDPVAIRISNVALSIRPIAGGQPWPFEGLYLDPVHPHGQPDFFHQNRRQHLAVKTSTAGAEAFQAVDGGHADVGRVEYEQYSRIDVPHVR